VKNIIVFILHLENKLTRSSRIFVVEAMFNVAPQWAAHKLKCTSELWDRLEKDS